MFEINHYLTQLNTFFELRNLADKTKENYLSSLKCYLKWLFDNKILPEEATFKDIRNFLDYLINTRQLSKQTINYYVSKIRFFQIYVLDKPWNPYQVPLGKVDRKLPEILTHQEALLFIDTLPNLADKAICSLMYGSGLRISEARRLKYNDISRANKQVYVRKAKSRSDRYTILSDQSLEILTQYWRVYGKPMDNLFMNRKRSDYLHSNTIDYRLKKHAKSLGWHKNVSAHMFRHSFAMHLYNRGADLLTIQKLLGHQSLQSTTVYVRLSNMNNLGIISPLDEV